MARHLPCLIGFITLFSIRSVDAVEFIYETMHFPGAEETFVNDITSDGFAAVGSYVDDTGEFGYVWVAGEFSSFDVDEQLSDFFLTGINNSFDVVGGAFDPPFDAAGFLIADGEPTLIEYPGAAETIATSVNDDLEIVGLFLENPEDDFRSFYTGPEGGFQELTISGFPEVLALGINNQGIIVGGAYDDNGVESGFILDIDGVTLLDHPDGETELLDVNDLGEVVGLVEDADGLRSFFFDGEDFYDVAFPGARETSVSAINNFGLLVGEYLPADSDDYHGFIAFPVPEPQALTLMCLGAASTLWRRRRCDRGRRRRFSRCAFTSDVRPDQFLGDAKLEDSLDDAKLVVAVGPTESQLDPAGA